MELALCSLSEYLYRHTTPEDAAKAQKVKLARIDSLLQLSDLVRWKLEIILQICDALQYLHRFNILHRDLKSPNVLLFFDTAKNKVIAKIGDFGLALAVDFITRTTTGHMVSKISTFLPNAVGTYNYMAPELFERQPGESVAYSESSDVYSLGILINEIMSGTMPWGGGAREVDIMNWVVNKSLRPDMWTVSAKPSAAERELFAIVGSSDSAHASCVHQSHQRRPSAYDVYIAAIGANPSARSPQNVPVAASDSKMSSRTGYEQVRRTVEDSILVITDDDQPLIHNFVGELLVRFNDISEKNAVIYAETLFRQSVTTCGRLVEQLRAKNNLKHDGAKEWLLTLGFHEFDIADIVDNMTAPPSENSREQVLQQQGVEFLESWIETNLPNINIPRNRRQWAQNLCDNNITTVHRLLKYGDDMNFLKSVGSSLPDMDAQDIFTYIEEEKERPMHDDCCEFLCFDFLPLIFDPVKRRSVKYQWTDNARGWNKNAMRDMVFIDSETSAICCSRVMSPLACMVFRCGCCITGHAWIVCPCLFPGWIILGVCICCDDHLCLKVCY